MNRLHRYNIMIDLGPQQDAIKEKYSKDYYHSPQCLAEVAALWGIDINQEANQHGVFKDYETETISAGAGSRHYAEIHLAQAPNGLWAAGSSYVTPISGAACGPSIWSPHAYESRQEARNAAIDSSIQGLEHARNRTDSCQTQSNIDGCNKLIQLLQNARYQQLSLFD